MQKIKFYQLEDVDEIDQLMGTYILERGWKYDEDCDDLGEMTVTDPTGTKWSLDKCIATLQGPLKVGDSDQTAALGVLDFFNLLYNWAYQEREPLEERGLL